MYIRIEANAKMLKCMTRCPMMLPIYCLLYHCMVATFSNDGAQLLSNILNIYVNDDGGRL